jgi:hypothetical protein
MKVPAPTFCPECRFQRRMAWRNERSFFHNTCAKCGKKIISVYPEDSGITVYCRPCWWTDNWDGLEYGADYDPSRPFLEQISDLLYKVPLPDLFGLYTTLENSDFINMGGYLKNCYFLTMADWNENCSYGSNIFHTKDSYDALMLNESELCYEAVNCRKCYKVVYSVDCDSCSDVSFSKNCIGCSNCIGCVNLRNKQYYIFNKPYSKEEYVSLAENYQPSSRKNIEKIVAEVELIDVKLPHKYMHERLTNNVTGDYIYNSKNVHDSFMVQDMENARFCSLVLPGKTTDCYDHTHYGINTEMLYETLQVGNQASKIIGSWFVITDVENVSYSMWGIGSKNIFGCVGLKKREYCILNKQYTKKEYEELVPKIIAQMNVMPYVDKKQRVYKYGDFFPIEMSPIPYNFSSANEVLPLTKVSVEKEGYKWKASKKSNYKITVSFDKIPDHTDEIYKDFVKEIFECKHKGECTDQCSTAFRVTQNELDFYRQMKLPLPNLCPNCRHYRRVLQKNPFRLWHRQCMCLSAGRQATKNTAKHFHGDNPCPNEFETSYAPDRPEIVYCEQCYQQEVA